MTTVAELEYPFAVVAHSGSAPWLGARIATREPLSATGMQCFGRFDHPGGTQYVYVTTSVVWDRDGHRAAVAWIHRVPQSFRVRLPSRRASRSTGMSLPSEAVISDDLSLELPIDLLGLDRWNQVLGDR